MAAAFRFLLAGIAAAVLPSAAPAADLDKVIFNDGFTIMGRHFRELETITDENGTRITVPKARGFDFIESGPKWIIFSNKPQQVGKLFENVKSDVTYREFSRDVYLKSRNALPGGTGRETVGEFNDQWVRKIHVDLPLTKGFTDIEQKIKVIGPTRVIIPSLNYRWYPYYDPREFDPLLIRKLLVKHPDLAEKPGEPDVGKRLDIAVYMKDAGWLELALKEIDDAKAAVPNAWSKELTERCEKLTADIHTAKNTLIAMELDKAVRAGKYMLARELIAKFDEKLAAGNIAKQFATLKAQVEIVEPRYEKGRRLLRAALDRLAGGSPNPASGALGGGLAIAGQAPALPGDKLMLLAAGEKILAELHPETAERIEHFITLADQAEKLVASGQDTGTTPEKLVAMAITGWVKGKNGAEQNPELAIRSWNWREMLLAYQAEPVLNDRRTIYQSTLAREGPLTPEEIAQLIGFLPPPQPEDLNNRGGVLVIPGATPLTGIYARRTPSVNENANGVDYIVRLPNEYHHGHPSRLLIALTDAGLPAEQLVARLAPDADRNGYIIVAPVWINTYDIGKPYSYTGDQHYKARAVLRDALRHFRIDNDRVFLFGFREGGNFALDLGASHPDLFAGVATMAANPKINGIFEHYWRNCQKLPAYVCFGAMATDTLLNVHRLFEEWMDKGYPALGVIYQGRGQEWFAPEVPVMFDWMDPKKRLHGVQVLKLDKPIPLQPWVSIRNADDRFYWIGSDKINPDCKYNKDKPLRSYMPAEIKADIRQGNQIIIDTRGAQNIVIWLDSTMINWSKPVSVSLNGHAPPGYKTKVLKPDIELMLEQLYHHGDRSLLFLNRLEFPTSY